ncbi:MAG: peptidoglycan DD-metalloendopeptidase family protein [Sneathiella sp.]
MRYLSKHIKLNFSATAVAALLFCLSALSFNAHNAAAGPNEELVKLRKALSASTVRQEEISARLQLLSGEITSLKEKSVRAGKRLRQLDQNMIETEDRLADIQSVEKQTLADLSKQNAGLADTLSALLRLSRQPEGSLIGSPENLINTLRAATLLKSVIPALKKQADQLSEQLDTLATLRDQYVTEQQKFVSLREARSSEQLTLDQLLDTKKATKTALYGRNAKEGREQQRLSTEARDLVTLMARLELQKKARLNAERKRIEIEIRRQEQLRSDQEKRRREEERRLADEQRLQNTETANSIPRPVPSRKNNVAPEPKKAPTKVASLSTLGSRRPFSSIKGTLPLPVGGRIVSNYTKTRKKQQRNGIVIETRQGAAVISPYDGQIAFAGPFRHYGLLLIIDHGGGYHTLLAGLGSIEGEVGQLLLAGEPVGKMNASNNVKPTLYMELRIKGSPVNPIPWLAAGYRKVSG